MSSTFLYILYGVCAISIASIAWMIRIELRLKKFFRGKNATDLESQFFDIVAKLSEIENNEKEIATHLINVEGRLNTTLRGFAMMRFNPFQDSGSNQSFSAAFLDERGSGIVISSLYARDRTSIFGKAITSGESEHELTDEEQSVVASALQKIKKH